MHTHALAPGQCLVLLNVAPIHSRCPRVQPVLALAPAAEVHGVSLGLGGKGPGSPTSHFLEEVPDPVCIQETERETKTDILRPSTRPAGRDTEKRKRSYQTRRQRQTDRWTEPFPAPSPCSAPSSVFLHPPQVRTSRLREVPHLPRQPSSARLPALPYLVSGSLLLQKALIVV